MSTSFKEAEKLVFEGKALLNEGNGVEASDKFQKAEQTLGFDSLPEKNADIYLLMSTIYSFKGELHMSSMEFEQAVHFFKRSLAYRQQIIRDSHSIELAIAHANLGSALFFMGNVAESIIHLKQASEAIPVTSSFYESTMANLSLAYKTTQQLDASKQVHEKMERDYANVINSNALKDQEKILYFKGNLGITKNHLANFYFLTKELSAAKTKLDEAKDILEGYMQGHSPPLTSCSLYGHYLVSMGRYQIMMAGHNRRELLEASGTLKTALTHFPSKVEEDTEGTHNKAMIFKMLGDINYEIGDSQQAFEYGKESLQYIEVALNEASSKGILPSNEANPLFVLKLSVLNLLTDVCHALDRLDEAAEYGLQLFRSVKDQPSGKLVSPDLPPLHFMPLGHNMGLLLSRSEDTKVEAIRIFEETMDKALEVGYHLLAPFPLNATRYALSKLYLDAGNDERSAKYANEALESIQQAKEEIMEVTGDQEGDSASSSSSSSSSKWEGMVDLPGLTKPTKEALVDLEAGVLDMVAMLELKKRRKGQQALPVSHHLEASRKLREAAYEESLNDERYSQYGRAHIEKKQIELADSYLLFAVAYAMETSNKEKSLEFVDKGIELIRKSGQGEEADGIREAYERMLADM
jgi:tetratricopeptide (TPR) repeat protein